MSISKRVLWNAVFVIGVSLLPVVSAQAAPARIPVTAFGSGSDSDQSSAKSDAKDNAESMLVCTGSLENIQTFSSGCIKTGSDDSPQYTCAATAKATCVIGY